MFLYFAFAGTQVANIGSVNNQASTTGQTTGFNVSVLLYISLVFGFSLAVNVWVFFRISGGLFNPAVTLAMTRGISWLRATLLFSAQIAGSILSSFLVKVMFPTQFNVRTTLSSQTSLVRGVFIEGVLTFELIFTVCGFYHSISRCDVNFAHSSSGIISNGQKPLMYFPCKTFLRVENKLSIPGWLYVSEELCTKFTSHWDPISLY